jgi:hypothetical protein
MNFSLRLVASLAMSKSICQGSFLGMFLWISLPASLLAQQCLRFLAGQGTESAFELPVDMYGWSGQPGNIGQYKLASNATLLVHAYAKAGEVCVDSFLEMDRTKVNLDSLVIKSAGRKSSNWVGHMNYVVKAAFFETKSGAYLYAVFGFGSGNTSADYLTFKPFLFTFSGKGVSLIELEGYSYNLDCCDVIIRKEDQLSIITFDIVNRLVYLTSLAQLTQRLTQTIFRNIDFETSDNELTVPGRTVKKIRHELDRHRKHPSP